MFFLPKTSSRRLLPIYFFPNISGRRLLFRCSGESAIAVVVGTASEVAAAKTIAVAHAHVARSGEGVVIVLAFEALACRRRTIPLLVAITERSVAVDIGAVASATVVVLEASIVAASFGNG